MKAGKSGTLAGFRESNSICCAGESCQTGLSEKHDRSEQEVGGCEVLEKDPRWSDATGWAGPKGLPQAGERFCIHRIAQPSSAVGDYVECNRRSYGSGEESRSRFGSQRPSDEIDGYESKESCAEDRNVRLVANAKRIGDCPCDQGEYKSAPAWGQNRSAKEDRCQGLEIWHRRWQGASQYAKCDQQACNQNER